jgi:hypothetical protein
MVPWFIATEPFTPAAGQAWDKYVAWSGLKQLKEVVSLDGMLCPTVLRETKDDYWPHIANEDFMLRFFVDFDFLMNQLTDVEIKNVLCVFRNPPRHPQAPSFADFQFLGYDLVDRECSVSALTNCGGFPDVFTNSELSPVGLLPDFSRAIEIQQKLRSLHPDEHHANCNMWAIFRLVGPGIAP